jgi:phage recombination protein Bet
MSDMTVARPPQRSLIATMAAKQGIEPDKYLATVRATILTAEASQEEMIAFLLVANKYDLNPFTREIFAFPKKGGGLQPIVSVDGWSKIMNDHPQFDGVEFLDNMSEDGQVESITCRIFRKDRTKPTECTEYMTECRRTTDPWRQWPRRMLRHKALIQCARYAFSFSGIIDEDEAERSPVVVVPYEKVEPAKTITRSVTSDDLLNAKKHDQPKSDGELLDQETAPPADTDGMTQAPPAETTTETKGELFENAEEFAGIGEDKVAGWLEMIALCENLNQLQGVQAKTDALRTNKAEEKQINLALNKRRKELSK